MFKSPTPEAISESSSTTPAELSAPVDANSDKIALLSLVVAVISMVATFLGVARDYFDIDIHSSDPQVVPYVIDIRPYSQPFEPAHSYKLAPPVPNDGI